MKNVSSEGIYVCATLGQKKGMGANVPSHEGICPWHAMGHFIENTALQVGVHVSSPWAGRGSGTQGRMSKLATRSERQACH